MKNLVILLTIFVIFVVAIVFFILLQGEDKLSVEHLVITAETKIPQKSNLNSEAEKFNSNTNASKTPLKTSDSNLQTTQNDVNTNDSMTMHKPEESVIQPQTVKIGMSSQVNDKSTKSSNSDSPLEQTKTNSSTTNTMELTNKEILDAQLFTFYFFVDATSNSTKYVEVSVPLKTHTGKIENYTYSAKLENEQFSLTWEVPGWYQVNNYGKPIKDVKQTYNSILFSKLTALKDAQSISLYQKVPVELTFVTSDGASIPDGSKIRFLEKLRWADNLTPLIVNQKGTIYIEPERVSEISTMSVGSYYADTFFIDSKSGVNLTRTIQLKKKVLFKLIFLDQKQKPLSDYYIVISKSYYPNGIYQVLGDYEESEIFDETKYDFLHKSNANGEINGEAETIGDYYLNIFGPKLKKNILKKITVASEGEKINILVDVSIVELKINFLENGKPYPEELSGSYLNNEIWGDYKTKTGFIILNQLRPGKIELHLKSDVFLNSTTKLVLPEEGSLEKNIELKPGAVLAGKVIANGSPIIGKNLNLYLYEKGFSSYDHFAETDLDGHFKFAGLNPEITYIFHVNLQNYILDPAFSNEYRSSEKEVSVNLIEKFDFSGLVFDEKGLPVNIENFSTSILRDGKIIDGRYPNINKNKFTIALDAGDTISFCIQTKGFSSHKQTIVFDPTLQTEPLNIDLKKGILVKGVAFDANNNPLNAGLVTEAIPFEYNNFFANSVNAGEHESTALSSNGTFQIENAQIGDKYFVLSKGNSPIPFSIEEKHSYELIELKATKSYSFSGNLRSQKNVLQEGRRVTGVRVGSKETVMAEVDAKGNFYIDCIRPGKWVFTSNFRDMYKVVPRIEIEIIDKDETYDWVVFR